MDLAKLIGMNIRRIRGDETQEQFAQRTGLDQSSLSQWENGRRLRYLQEFADRLESVGIDPLELIAVSRPVAEEDEALDYALQRLLRTAKTLPARHRAVLTDVAEAFSSRAVDAESSEIMAQLRVASPETRRAVLAAVEFILQRQHDSTSEQ